MDIFDNSNNNSKICGAMQFRLFLFVQKWLDTDGCHTTTTMRPTAQADAQ